MAGASAGGSGYKINRYDEYGVRDAGNLGRFAYTGQTWLPEFELYNYKARVYGGGIGRFYQVDPIGYKDQMNLYGYVGGDPINGTDPTGMFDVRVQLIGEQFPKGSVTGHTSVLYTDTETGKQFTANAGPVPGGTDRGILEPIQNRLTGVADKLLGGAIYPGDKTATVPGREIVSEKTIKGTLDDAMKSATSYVETFNNKSIDYNLIDPNSNTFATGDYYHSTAEVPDMTGATRIYPGANSQNNPVNPPPRDPLNDFLRE